jgi:hypothetical protein
VRRWRDGFTERAQGSAETLVEALGGGVGAVDTTDDATIYDGAPRRIVHPRTGLSLSVPREWALTRATYIRPLAFLGIAPLKRFRILGEEKPYTDGEPWDQLVARGAPEIGLSVIVREGPIRADRARWLNSSETAEKHSRVQSLEIDPQFAIDGMSGFSVLNSMPARSVVVHFGQLAKPVLLRLAWVGNSLRHLEFAAIAPADRPEVMKALEVMIRSLRSV